MKSFSAFLIEENKQTIIHKLGWQDADNWWGTTMNYKKKISIANEHGKKIGDGSYGACGMCGVTIPLGRLKAKPFAKFCTECREVYEKEEALKVHS